MKVLGKVEMIAKIKEKIAASTNKEEAEKLKRLLKRCTKGADVGFI